MLVLGTLSVRQRAVLTSARRPGTPAISGNWNGEFNGQGDNGNFWSASAHPDNADDAFNVNFNAGEVNPADNNDRNAGFSVR